MEKQLPKNWVEVQLIDVLEVLENGSRPKGGVQGILEGVPSLGGEHLNSNGSFKLGNLKYVPTSFAEKMNRGRIKEKDILVVKDGATTGKTSFVGNDFPFDLAFVNEHVFICRTFPNLNSKSIFYFLFSKIGFDRIMENFTGSAQGGINQKFANNTLIPLPPLSEQNRIVTKLDALFAQLETIKSSMANVPLLLKDFRQQVLTQAVTGKLTEEWRKDRFLEEWRKVELGEICSLKAGKFISASEINNEKQDGYFPCYGGNGLRGYVKSFTHIGKYSLIGRQGALCGNVHLIEGQFHATEHALVVTPIIGIDEIWLFFKLTSLELINYAKGVAQPGLSVMNLNPIPINIPPIKEQQEIVSRIESLFAKADAIEKQYESLKAKIDNLPQALLHKAFKGELTEQLDSDGSAKELLKEIEALKAVSGKVKKGGKVVKEYEEKEEVFGMVAEK